MGNRNQELGKWGEQQASDYLLEKGYEIIGRNIRTPYGEIDILASLGKVLIFIEVKTRVNNSYGDPETAINDRKLMHMEESASYYIQQSEYSSTWQWDVIAILKSKFKPVEIIHFENVIS